MVDKVSTRMFFDSSAKLFARIQNEAARTQAQLSTGLQLLKPSDEPDKAVTVNRINSAISRQDSIEKALGVIRTRLSAQEVSLRGVSDMMARLKELAIQASNDTYSTQQLQALAEEAIGIRASLTAAANARDELGGYLFAGTRTGAPPFASAGNGGGYEGDSTRTTLSDLTNGETVSTQPGTDVFGGLKRPGDAGWEKISFFQSVDEFVSALESGDRSNVQRAIGEMDELGQSVNLGLANLGARQDAIDWQQSLVSETRLRLQETLSNTQDLDYASAVTKLNQQMLALESGMNSFAKLSQLNLFSILR